MTNLIKKTKEIAGQFPIHARETDSKGHISRQDPSSPESRPASYINEDADNSGAKRILRFLGSTVTLAFCVGLLAGTLLGLVFGIDLAVSRAMYFVEGAFSGSTIIIDVNETELVNRVNETIVPTLLSQMEEGVQR